jgi:hypothetical protein
MMMTESGTPIIHKIRPFMPRSLIEDEDVEQDDHRDGDTHDPENQAFHDDLLIDFIGETTIRPRDGSWRPSKATHFGMPMIGRLIGTPTRGYD